MLKNEILNEHNHDSEFQPDQGKRNLRNRLKGELQKSQPKEDRKPILSDRSHRSRRRTFDAVSYDREYGYNAADQQQPILTRHQRRRLRNSDELYSSPSRSSTADISSVKTEPGVGSENQRLLFESNESLSNIKIKKQPQTPKRPVLGTPPSQTDFLVIILNCLCYRFTYI